ncbi:MAG: hypothetical protein RLZ37_870 [Actinomycetota bacterium]|jgi:hypothetical protein
MADPRPLSALPSPLARALAFASILLGGVAGGLIGYALVDIQYSGDSSIPLGIGLLAGSIIAAGGTAIVAVLVLRALGEWRDVELRSSADSNRTSSSEN